MGDTLATSYTLIIVLLIVLVVVFAVVWGAGHAAPATVEEEFPYQAKSVMTAAEQRLFILLRQALPDFYICPQVQLSALVEPAVLEKRQYWFNRISRMSIDFVILSFDGKHVVALVELDDWSHEMAHRIEADMKKDKVLSRAELPLIRYMVEEMPRIETIQRDIQEILHQDYT